MTIHRITVPKALTPLDFPTAPLLPPLPDAPDPLVGTPTGPVSVELCPATEVADEYALFAASWFTSALNSTRSMIWNTPFLTSTSG